MTIFSRYLMRNVFIGFAAAAGLLIPLFTTFTLINELEDVTPGGYRWQQALLVTVMTLPRSLVDLGPFIALLGGIVGLGETVRDRAGLLVQLANLPKPPESVPINMLVKVKGTPLADNDDVDAFDFIRTIAIARIMMPTSYVRLSAGREQMNEQTQAMCFMAGANSIFYGCKLLTTPNPEEDKDVQLFRKLGLNPHQTEVLTGDNEQQQQLEQQIFNADTDQFYNAAAV